MEFHFSNVAIAKNVSNNQILCIFLFRKQKWHNHRWNGNISQDLWAVVILCSFDTLDLYISFWYKINLISVDKLFFFNVGPPKEDIFFDHLSSSSSSCLFGYFHFYVNKYFWSRRLAFFEAPSAGSRLIRFHGNQQDNVGIPSAKRKREVTGIWTADLLGTRQVWRPLDHDAPPTS